MGKNKKSIYILVISNFLICLGIGLVIPVTPFIKNEFHYTTSQMGVMTSLFAFAQFIASPIVGKMSDKVGRKPVIVLGLIGYAISEFIFAVATSLPIFNLSRIIGGLSAAMVVPTSMALGSDLTSLKDRAKVIGWLSAAFSGGLILGPGLGGILANITYKTPFYVAGVLGLVSAVFTQVLLKENKEVLQVEEAEAEKKAQEQGSIRSILTLPMVMLFGMILVSSFGLQGFESIYSIYVNQVFDFGLSTIALVLTLNGIISLILQVAAFNWIINKIGEMRLISIAFLLSAVCVFWITQAHSHVEVIVATLIIFSSFDLLRPAITTLLTKSSRSNQGLINGMNMSLTSVGNVIGPLMSGALMDMNTHYPYLVVTFILAASYLLTFVVRRHPIAQAE
ncbi:major facilitator superfamily permease [Companilactobacillus mindensis DSM 14500]|uniref:Major facilitator superfamily permease n=1 Tax=Companilactobacillus mindensis DSM 14500 TaxID=1423770 RepID=A0A0R1QE12_9LACO|nr:MFS transporter [Companilactobacillus mindensis]KRL42753.1 major facilitator superfamily permease [Companilactobacillus mindensis DSM 14500]GEO79070.1 tetracycline resistance MFS efflux pump [Companilactobacillus mindensis]